jgi:hypothetical protein
MFVMGSDLNSLFKQGSGHPYFLVVLVIETELFPYLLLEATGFFRLPDKEQRKLLGPCGIAGKSEGKPKLVFLLPIDLMYCHPLVGGVERVDV